MFPMNDEEIAHIKNMRKLPVPEYQMVSDLAEDLASVPAATTYCDNVVPLLRSGS
jgi:hypothetical protein